MTAEQRKLFAYQRDRLPMLEDEDSFDSDLDVDQDIRHPKAIKEFISQIARYKIETDLDRKLLLGVLVRDHHLKQDEDRSVDRHLFGSRGELSLSQINVSDSINSRDHYQVQL